jgi:hypothetical protein
MARPSLGLAVAFAAVHRAALRPGHREANHTATANGSSPRLRRSATPRAIAALVDTGRQSLSNEGPLKPTTGQKAA